MNIDPTWPQELLAARVRIADAHAADALRAHVMDELSKAVEEHHDARVRCLWFAVAITESSEAVAALSDAERESVVASFGMVSSSLSPSVSAPIKQWFLAMRSLAFRRDAKWLSALQAAESGYAAHTPAHPVAVNIFGEALIRQGMPRIAHQLWQQSPPVAASLRCARMLNLPVNGDGQRSLELSEQWENLVAHAQAQALPLLLLRRLGRGSSLRTHDRLVIAALWGLAALKSENFDQLPGLRGIKDLIPPDAHDSRGWRRAVDMIGDLRDLLGSASPSGEAIARCADAAGTLPDIEAEALTIAVCLRLFRRTPQANVIANLTVRYRTLNLAITDGRADDPWRLLEGNADKTATLPSNYFNASSQIKRFTALSTSVMTTALSGWVQQLFIGPGGADAHKQRQAEKYARQLRDFLGSAKGVMLKGGQIIEFVEHAMPEGAAAQLQAVRRQQTAPLTPRVARDLVEAEFKKPIKDVFSEWDEMPVAAASIGQVHRARLHNGMEVAVKVKFPEMEGLMRRQLRLLSFVAPLLERLFPGVNIRQTIKGCQHILLRECDFELEARHQTLFRDAVASIPGVIVPAIVPEYSGKNVITMEFVRGTRFWEYVAVASQADRNRTGAAIYQAITHAALAGGIRHGDPHPGNFLFVGDKVAILDFGAATTEVDRANGYYLSLLDAIRRKDVEGVVKIHQDYGFLQATPAGKADNQALFDQTAHDFSPVSSDQDFSFTKAFLLGNMRDVSRNASFLQVPSYALEFIRGNVGLASTLAALEATANWARIIDLITEQSRQQKGRSAA